MIGLLFLFGFGCFLIGVAFEHWNHGPEIGFLNQLSQSGKKAK